MLQSTANICSLTTYYLTLCDNSLLRDIITRYSAQYSLIHLTPLDSIGPTIQYLGWSPLTTPLVHTKKMITFLYPIQSVTYFKDKESMHCQMFESPDICSPQTK